VLPFLKQLKSKGVLMSVYSSGSKKAQDLFFRYSQEGDVRHFFESFFDLEMGSKKDRASYLSIVEALNVSPAQVLFFTDHPDELKAATQAGLEAIHTLRPGVSKAPFQSILSFDDVVL